MYTNKLDQLDYIDKFLETQNLLRLNHKEIENLNRSITSKETESVIKASQQQQQKSHKQQKTLDLMASLVNSTKHLNKNQSSNFPKK